MRHQIYQRKIFQQNVQICTKYNTMRYADNVDDDRECESEEEIDIVQRLFLSCLIRCNA